MNQQPTIQSAVPPTARELRRAQYKESKNKRRASKAVHSFNNARKESARQALLAIASPNGSVVMTGAVEAFHPPEQQQQQEVPPREDRRARFSSKPSVVIMPESHHDNRHPHDMVSVDSHERAFIRGSHRGSFELNERLVDFDHDHDNDNDNDSMAISDDSFQRHMLDFEHRTATTALSTLPESTVEETKPHKQRLFGFRSSKKHRKQQQLELGSTGSKRSKSITKIPRKKRGAAFLTSEINSPEAWMCGVCAKTFSTMEAAEKHEQRHILQVVHGLGYIPNENDNDGDGSSVIMGMMGSSLQNQPFTPLRKGAGITTTTAFNFDNVDNRAGPIKSKRLSNQLQPPPLPPPPPPTKASRKLGNHSKVSFLETGMETLPTSQPFHLKSTTANSSINNINNNGSSNDTLTYPKKSCIRNLELEDILEQDRLLIPHGMKDFVVLADEGLIDCCQKAESYILTEQEREAELELELLAHDKDHYDLLAERQTARERRDRYHALRTEGKTVVERIQNKFVDAYQLMKEGNTKNNAVLVDHYNRKAKGDETQEVAIEHGKGTMYVNVIVKNSIRVVNHELERLAKRRWEDENKTNGKKKGTSTQAERFQRFRAAAQGNLVKLAGLALASDFTPRRIAVQLSNDVYRHFPPRLKRNGVTIENEIEYRVGPYFVLAVNVREIDWRKFVKSTHRDVRERHKRWKRSALEECAAKKRKGIIKMSSSFCVRLYRMSKYELLSYFIAMLYYFHWTIYLPICLFTYHFMMGNLYRTYMLQNVADDTFVLVEEKGMEMQVGIRQASMQAAFMLSALREIRDGGRKLKDKQKESDSVDKGSLLGPLLGPAIKFDKDAAPPKPDGFEVPESLEFIGLELNLPVGFRRLRWALLHTECRFMPDAVFHAEAKYENITIEKWSKHDDVIGAPTTPDDVKEEDFIGAERVASYLMPKSAFVKANMCTETAYIEAYNDYCFVIKKKALTPDVPYGSTFVAWTKYIVINTGNNTCKMICSVEAEFPNGPPMIARQIKSGMRAGVGELFVLTGETISKYADVFP